MFHAAHSARRPSAATTIATVVFVSFLAAGASRAGAEPGQDGSPNKKALVGSWLETVTFPPESGRPPLKSLGSFHADGTMECSDQGSVSTAPPPSVFTSCHGAWTHLEDRRFAYTALELISDLSGNLVGYLKVRGIYTVAESGNEYTGVSFAEIRDTGGNVLFSVEVTNVGTRIQVELP
jgi:hypothetical protein